jgi:hypothetical protein
MVLHGGYSEYIYPVPVRNSIRYLTASYQHGELLHGLHFGDAIARRTPNCLLRSTQPVITGVNSADVVNTNSVTALLPGISTHHAELKVPAGPSADGSDPRAAIQ